MGTCHYLVCHDCKKYIDLDKTTFHFAYNISSLDYTMQEIVNSLDKEDLHPDEYTLYYLFKLLAFYHKHSGHRTEYYTEHTMEYLTGEILREKIGFKLDPLMLQFFRLIPSPTENLVRTLQDVPTRD